METTGPGDVTGLAISTKGCVGSSAGAARSPTDHPPIVEGLARPAPFLPRPSGARPTPIRLAISWSSSNSLTARPMSSTLQKSRDRPEGPSIHRPRPQPLHLPVHRSLASGGPRASIKTIPYPSDYAVRHRAIGHDKDLAAVIEPCDRSVVHVGKYGGAVADAQPVDQVSVFLLGARGPSPRPSRSAGRGSGEQLWQRPQHHVLSFARLQPPHGE